MKNNAIKSETVMQHTDKVLIDAVSAVMDFCMPTDTRGQWLAFAMMEPRQMFVHANLWMMFSGNEESDERWIQEHTPSYLIKYFQNKWQRRKRIELRIKHTEWCLKFLHAAIGALNVSLAVKGLPYHDPNKSIDVFVVVGPGDDNGMIDTSDIEHTNPLLHFIFRGGHIERMERYDAGLEKMVNDMDRSEKEAAAQEAKRIEDAKKKGNPLAGTEFEILLG